MSNEHRLGPPNIHHDWDGSRQPAVLIRPDDVVHFSIVARSDDRGKSRRGDERRAFDAQSANEAEKVYAGLGSRVGREDRPREVTAMFVAAGALLLAGAAGLALLGAPRLP